MYIVHFYSLLEGFVEFDSLFTTQFEIKCRCGGHSVTQKFKTILQILMAKPKLSENLYFYK